MVQILSFLVSYEFGVWLMSSATVMLIGRLLVQIVSLHEEPFEPNNSEGHGGNSTNATRAGWQTS